MKENRRDDDAGYKINRVAGLVSRLACDFRSTMTWGGVWRKTKVWLA